MERNDGIGLVHAVAVSLSLASTRESDVLVAARRRSDARADV